jgi:hypothetical protein
MEGGNVSNPILQIIQVKNIQNNMDGTTRYKICLSDGETQHSCKLKSYFIQEVDFLISYLYFQFNSWNIGNSEKLFSRERRAKSRQCYQIGGVCSEYSFQRSIKVLVDFKMIYMLTKIFI